MTALEEYTLTMDMWFYACVPVNQDSGPWVKRSQADAAIESLKCCGNCDNYGDRGEDYNCAATPTGLHGYHPPRVVDHADHCHFTPSRWEERV